MTTGSTLLLELLSYTTFSKLCGILFPEVLIIQIPCIIRIPTLSQSGLSNRPSLLFKSFIGFPFHLEQNPNSWPGSTSTTWSRLLLFPLLTMILPFWSSFWSLNTPSSFPFQSFAHALPFARKVLLCLVSWLAPYLSDLSSNVTPSKGYSLASISKEPLSLTCTGMPLYHVTASYFLHTTSLYSTLFCYLFIVNLSF